MNSDKSKSFQEFVKQQKAKGDTRWERYSYDAKPKLDELIEYCQSDGKIVPKPYAWAQLITQYSEFQTSCTPLLPPLILGAYTASFDAKRLRFLTHIYWGYQNYHLSSMHTTIIKIKEEDWTIYDFTKEDEIRYKLSLSTIKKEYASWLGVKAFP